MKLSEKLAMDHLSGAAKDTLYKLGKYGAQEDGNLPSKIGMMVLIGKGMAYKDCDLDKPNNLTENGFVQYKRLFL